MRNTLDKTVMALMGLSGLVVLAGVAAAAPPAPKQGPPGTIRATGRKDVKELDVTPKIDPGEKVATALLELGQQKFAAGDNEAALTAFGKAHDAHPRDPRPYYMRATVYQKLGKLTEAEADLRAALRLEPRLYDVRAELAAILTNGGRAAEAEELLAGVVRERPEHYEAWFNLGVARDALSRFADAVEAYRRAARLKPQDADVRVLLATALRRAGRLDEAVAVAKEAVTLAPDDGEAHLNLGLLLVERKQLDEAAAELTAATRLKPELPKAWRWLGITQMKRNQPAAAIVALQKAQQLKPSAEVLTELGLAQRKQGSVAEAERSFRMALDVDPRYHAARVHWLYTLAATNRCPEVRKELGKYSLPSEFTESLNRIKATCQWADSKK